MISSVLHVLIPSCKHRNAVFAASCTHPHELSKQFSIFAAILMEVFDRLNALSEDADLSDLFLGVASYEATTKIIDDLNYSLDLILDASSTIDINAPVVNKFLRTSFPFLIELFLRRKSARYFCYFPLFSYCSPTAVTLGTMRRRLYRL